MENRMPEDDRRVLAVLEEMNVAAFMVPAARETANTWMNAPAKRVLEMLGQPADPLLLQGDIAEEIERLLQAGVRPVSPEWLRFIEAIRAGARFARFELNYPAGKHHMVTFNLAADGVVSLFISDISELAQFRLQRHRTDKLATLGRLAANYAHDFNNYLAVIDRQLELMAVQDGLTPELARLL